MSFCGKVVLITGASSGIGADAARHLAKLGASVSIVGRNEKRLNEVAEQIIKSGSPKPLPIVADVTKDAKHIIDETVKQFGQIDVLVNNAGVFRVDSVTDFNVNEYDKLMDINLRSAIVLTNLAVPYLEKTRGNVINVSSDSGITAYGNYLSYCVSKAGLDHFTKCAAIGLAEKKVRVNSINPGDIRTPIFETIGLDVKDYFEKAEKMYLVGRVGEVSDTSAAIEFLATQSFINGISIWFSLFALRYQFTIFIYLPFSLLSGILLSVDGGLSCSGIHID